MKFSDLKMAQIKNIIKYYNLDTKIQMTKNKLKLSREELNQELEKHLYIDESGDIKYRENKDKILKIPEKEKKPKIIKIKKKSMKNEIENNNKIIKIKKDEDEEKKEKKTKFSYDKNFYDFFIDLFNKAQTKKINDSINKGDLETLINASKTTDFFPTNEKTIKNIISSSEEYFQKEKINILEPSCGLGFIIIGLLNSSLNINSIDAIEYNQNIYNLVKNKISGVSFINDDFLEYETKKNYDLIIMNPPFSGETNKIYLAHILKAYKILLDSNNKNDRKLLFFISPELDIKDNIIKIPNSILKFLKKKNLDYDDLLTDGGLYCDINKIMKADDFKKLDFKSYDWKNQYIKSTDISFKKIFLYSIYV
jgi:predicted RNA methylase